VTDYAETLFAAMNAAHQRPFTKDPP
jgi:hypothetical protein